MHELSIAIALVDAACDQLRELGVSTRAVAVHMRVGVLSGVVPEALQFSFDMAASGSRLDGARLEIERIDTTVWCDDCAAERRLDQPFCLECPVCGALTPRVLRGRELELAALEIDDDADR